MENQNDDSLLIGNIRDHIAKMQNYSGKMEDFARKSREGEERVIKAGERAVEGGKRAIKELKLIMAGLVVIILALFAVSYFMPYSQNELEYKLQYEEVVKRSKESEHLLEQAIRKLELNTRESENLVAEIRLLKKEVFVLKLRVDNLEVGASSDTQNQSDKGQEAAQ